MDSKIHLKEKNPNEEANILSKLLILWSAPIFMKGNKKDLGLEQLWQTRSFEQSGKLGDRLEQAWTRELDVSRKDNSKPSLSKAIVRCFWFEYMLCGFLVTFLYVCIWPLIPFTLNLVIEYFANEKTPESYVNAHVHNFLMVFCTFLTPILASHMDLLQGCVGMRIRVACCSLIYRKVYPRLRTRLPYLQSNYLYLTAVFLIFSFFLFGFENTLILPFTFVPCGALGNVEVNTKQDWNAKHRPNIKKQSKKILKLNRIGLNKTEPGQVINLMSNDVSRFDIVVLYLHFIWVTPLIITVVSFLVWQQIAWATFAGIAAIFIETVVVQIYLGNLQGTLRGKVAGRTDMRIKVMSELVNGVQVIKMYAWEKPFENLVVKLRKNEIKFISRANMVKGVVTGLMVFTEKLNLCAAIATFVMLGGNISAGITFSILQYFNILQSTCNAYFPWALSNLAEVKVSIRRIEEFLMLDENRPMKTDIKKDNPMSNGIQDKKSEKVTKSSGLILSNVTASWQADPILATLKNINLLVNPGDFVGVAGLVGSGKSSLLQVILGELQPSEGTVALGGAKVSYASQEPWLFVASVRQNILFGLPYDSSRYKKVVTACALVRDFEQLPLGDATLVGERGISLSGGQRARIGLARACYRQADIYLLDDPLSAVDTHVGKHLISECVMGFLKNSTRILVTHQLHHLENADKVIILHNGQIEVQGSFSEVSTSKLFEQMLERADEEKTEEDHENNLNREMSIASFHTIAESVQEELEEEPEETAELMGKDKASGSVYIRYFRSGGGWGLLIFTLSSILLAQVTTTISDLWLTHWMNDIEAKHSYNLNNISQSFYMSHENRVNYTTSQSNITTSTEDIPTFIDEAITDTVTTSTTGFPNLTVIGTMMKTALTLNAIETDNFDHLFYIYVWIAALIACSILTTFRSLLFMWVCMRSSINMHNKMFSNILSATMRFFDTNPSGRILNRFSKDMGAVDEILPKMFIESVQIIMVMTGIIVMVLIVNPYMIVTTIVCGIVIYYLSLVYFNTAQAIKRLESVSRSPVFSHVSASMAGLGTVRACDAQNMLRKNFDDKQDVHTAAWYLTLVTNATFSLWISLIIALYIAAVAYTFLLLDDGTTKSGDVGLAISQGIILVYLFHYCFKQSAAVIAQMISVERILEYTSLPQEKRGGTTPPPEWPKTARVEFKNLYLRYDPNAEPILKNLNITIESGWKVGVVGRTGAGKSSLISGLFRLAPIDGHVYIDELETGELSLQGLRSKISIIPQEPILFSASLRYNLDPFDKYSDADIWRALEQVELKDTVTSLSFHVESGGTNFSAGQRQLLCLARAALARNRLLVLDEATANVDPNTDALIQKSIRTFFSDCTVITVAHRLHTIADADRVIVMDAGQVVEFGHPHELLLKEDGHFTKMVEELSPASEQSLRNISKEAYILSKNTRTDDCPQSTVFNTLEK